MHALHLDHPPEPPGRIVRLGAIVIGEDGVESIVAKQCTSKGPDLLRCLDPGRGFGVEGVQGLEMVILLLGQEVNAHFRGHANGAVFGLVLLPGCQSLWVVADAAASLGAFG